jgi:hypothetical protein
MVISLSSWAESEDNLLAITQTPINFCSRECNLCYAERKCHLHATPKLSITGLQGVLEHKQEKEALDLQPVNGQFVVSSRLVSLMLIVDVHLTY